MITKFEPRMLRLYVLLSTVLIFAIVNAQVPVSKKILTEKDKIEALILSVEKLDGAKFIRNGTEYDGAAAASHLRMKLSKASSQVKTAEDFIEKIGSKSSVSGETYKIKYKDGKTINTRDFFISKLKEIVSII